MRKLLFPFTFLSSLALISCTTILSNLPGVYSVDIQQGNIVEQSMIDQLKPHMTKRQVLYIMGSPMLIDSFHSKRWDYIYAVQPHGEERQQKKITLIFNNDDEIVGVQGDFKPGSGPVIKPATDATVDVPKRELDRTISETITGLFSSDPVDTSSSVPSTAGSLPDEKKAAEDKKAAEKSATDAESADKAAGGKPTAEEKSDSEKTATEATGVDKAATEEKPDSEKSSTDAKGTDKTETDKPAAEDKASSAKPEPASDKPARAHKRQKTLWDSIKEMVSDDDKQAETKPEAEPKAAEADKKTEDSQLDNKRPENKQDSEKPAAEDKPAGK